MELRPETQKDIALLRERLKDSAIGQVALHRIENDLERLVLALDNYGLHLRGHGCGSKKLGDACNCGLDRSRERAGLPRTFSKDGPKPWPKNRP